jgi:hypothetical protein
MAVLDETGKELGRETFILGNHDASAKQVAAFLDKYKLPERDAKSELAAAIAETGTLMLPSAPERPTTLNLLADTAIVVLRASNLVGAYEEAWDKLRAEMGGMPRNVMLVTGPSRSADIEQTLELGAHGPRNLHVVLVED